jgi:hypothetical protein
MKVTVVDNNPGVSNSFYVRVSGFAKTFTSPPSPKDEAEALAREVSSTLGLSCLTTLHVINYGLAGRSIEVEFPDGERMMLAIPESQQPRFREIMNASRGEDNRKTSFERIMADD